MTYTSDHTGAEIDSAITEMQGLAAKLNNMQRCGELASTIDSEQTFTFDTPFSSADGTTDADICVVISRMDADTSFILPVTSTSLTGFTINRHVDVDGSEAFNYIAVNGRYGGSGF